MSAAAVRLSLLAALLATSTGHAAVTAPRAEAALLARRQTPIYRTPDVQYRNTFPREGVVENAQSRGEAATTPSGDRGRSVKALNAREDLVGGAQRPEKQDKYSLNHGQLSDIYSVDCLERRQKDPRDPCWRVGSHDYVEEAGPLNIGSFPSWRDRRCRSNGQLFCDPDNLINNRTMALSLTNMLGTFRQTTRVKCGQLESNLQASLAPLHERPFSLGVAIAHDWPDNEIDNDSLQRFGDNLFRQWGMLPFYNGVDAMNGLNPSPDTASQRDTNCPNAALLIILPKYDIVYTATPGCQFFCHDNGGVPIDQAVLATLEERGLADAITVGIQQVGNVIHVANSVPKDMETYGPRSYWRRSTSVEDKYERSETAWIVAMRVLMVFVVIFALVVCTQFCLIAAGQPLKTKLQRTAAAAAARNGGDV